MEYPIYFSAKRTFVGRQRLTCQRPDLNYLAAEGQKDDIMSMLSSAFQDKITRNRSILHSILKTIYLPVCGKQNIPLRGHTEEKSNCIAQISV
jgi:hypothetical protein